jgi:hypothetical protein
MTGRFSIIILTIIHIIILFLLESSSSTTTTTTITTSDFVPPHTSADGSFENCGTCEMCASSAPTINNNNNDNIPSHMGTDLGHDNAQAYLLSKTSKKCKKCFGCTHVIKPMPRKITMKNETYEPEIGASPANLMKIKKIVNEIIVDDVDDDGDDWAVAKMWCVGTKLNSKGKEIEDGGAGQCYRKKGNTVEDTTGKQRSKALQTIKNSMTLQKILDFCDSSEISVKHWTESVKTVHPTSKRKIHSEVLFMSVAPGISITQLDSHLVRVNPRAARNALANVDHDSVIKATVLDALLGQCDRHSENIFIDIVNETHSKMMFIDNDQMFGRGWRACVAESVLIPGSEKFSIARFSNSHVNGHASANKASSSRSVSLSVMLDYRCHAKNGFLGKDSYGEGIDKCLKKLSEMSVNEAIDQFGFSEQADAKFVLARAKGLRELGFERAILNWQRNSNLKSVGIGKNFRSFPWPNTCCYPKLSLNNKNDPESSVSLSCEFAKNSFKCKGGADKCMRAGGWEIVS